MSVFHEHFYHICTMIVIIYKVTNVQKRYFFKFKNVNFTTASKMFDSSLKPSNSLLLRTLLFVQKHSNFSLASGLIFECHSSRVLCRWKKFVSSLPSSPKKIFPTDTLFYRKNISNMGKRGRCAENRKPQERKISGKRTKNKGFTLRGRKK